MAEALGLASGVISIASFAIQLADSVQKACDFWESVEDAPEDIDRLSKELRLLSNILRFISHEHTSGVSDTAQDSLVMSALQIAKEDINGLTVIITQLASKIDQGRGKLKRKWGQIQIALKSEKIKKLKNHIESAKSTLNMLQASRTQVAMCQMNGQLEMLASNLSVGMQRRPGMVSRANRALDKDGLNTQVLQGNAQGQGCIDSLAMASQGSSGRSALQTRTKTSWASINAGIALLTFQSSSTAFYDFEESEEDGDSTVSTKKTFTVNFLWGYSSCRRGVRLSTNSFFDSLRLNSVRRRPANSQIFMLCEEGDTMGVRKLLQTGEASLFDTDERGQGLLHIACEYGRSDLAQMLLRSDIDYYAKSDYGQTPLDELEDYDKECGPRRGRNEITRITETLVRETDFDPLDYKYRPGCDFTTLALWNGLPYETLKYLFSQDSRIVTTENRFDLIYENLFVINDSIDDFESYIYLLLTKYEAMRRDTVIQDDDDGWPYRDTLLQVLIRDWISESVYGTSRAEKKICCCLTLTTDLYATEETGTCLDVIATVGPGLVQPWLELLAKNGIDVSEYLQYESDQHPEGIIYQADAQCCRLISLRFQHGDNGITGVEVDDICNPEYIHFHPEYRCAAGTRKERCITQLHDVIIDENGKPEQSIPGSWSGVLKPNSGCFLVIRDRTEGKEYVEHLEKLDYVWDEESGEWRFHYG